MDTLDKLDIIIWYAYSCCVHTYIHDIHHTTSYIHDMTCGHNYAYIHEAGHENVMYCTILLTVNTNVYHIKLYNKLTGIILDLVLCYHHAGSALEAGSEVAMFALSKLHFFSF